MKLDALGKHAKFIRGITFKPNQKCKPFSDGSIVCMRTKNVQTELDETDLIAVPADLVKNHEKMLRGGDTLVSSANSWNLVGKCCHVPSLTYKATAGGFISILRSTNGALDSKYLYHWFSSTTIQRTLRSFGNQTTNISNLDHNRALKLRIPLPPLPEQRRIAAILDEADGLRTRRRASLAELDTLLQSTFLQMFGDPVTNPMGWERCNFGSLIVDGPQNGLYKPANLYGQGTRILRIDGFYDGSVTDLSTLKRVTLNDAERKSYGLKESDIIINRVNSRQYLGKSAIIPPLDEPVVFESNMMRLRADANRLNAVFVVKFLQTKFVKNQILRSAKDAVNQSSINQTDVKGFEILLPPLALQREFAAIVESVEAQKARMRAHLAELDTLFAALQAAAFQGEL